MFSVTVYEDLDNGKGVAKSGGLESPVLRDAIRLWTQYITGEQRKPGSYAVFTDDNGDEIARYEWK